MTPDMVRMTEPMPCPGCRRPVVPGEAYFYDLSADGLTTGDVHSCDAPRRRCPEAQPDMRRDRLDERIDPEDQ